MSKQSDYQMERGIAQILNSYGSENVFDFGQLGLTMAVNPWERADKVEGVDKERIASIIQSRVPRYNNRTTSDTWDNISADNIEIWEPRKVECELFPRVFHCENQDCRKVHSAEEVRYLPSDGNCEDCGSSLRQLPFVNVCQCGKLEDPKPREKCPTHGFDSIHINKRGDPVNWWYECSECGHDMGGMGTFCGTCQEMTGPLPTASSRIFYPEKAVEVDIPLVHRDTDELPGRQVWAKVLMGAHLGLTESADTTLEDIATTSQRAEKFQEWADKFGEEQARAMMDEITEGVLGRETIINHTEHLTPPETEYEDDEGEVELAYSNVAHQLFTFIRSTQGYSGDQSDLENTRHPRPQPLSDFLSDQSFRERHPQSGRYRSQLTQTHIREAWIVDQFPLLNILYGYTRADPSSIRVDLNAFPHPRKRSPTPVFVDRTPSEAIIFELDRKAIVNWLAANDYLTATEKPDTSDEQALKEWFLTNIATTELNNPFTPVDDEVTKMTYRLLHTISHCLLARAGEQCGLATSSLSERIFPVVPAITIYAASTENFALGSMFTMFKTRLHPWVADAREIADRCLIDSTCREQPDGAACDACLHIEETSCESVNLHLDRGLLNSKSDSVGFWDGEIENGIPSDLPGTDDTF